MSQDCIRNIIQENASLKDQNKDLKERCENLVYAMGALKRDVNNLEEEKKSLLTVIKLLQADAEKLNDHQHNWNKVKERTVEKHKNTLSNHNNEMQISNTVEIQSDSDDNINPPEIPIKSRKQKNDVKKSTQVNKASDQSVKRSGLNSTAPNANSQPNRAVRTIIVGGG